MEIVRDYGKEYSKILAKQERLSHAYIDAFAGAGEGVLRTTGEDGTRLAAERFGDKPAVRRLPLHRHRWREGGRLASTRRRAGGGVHLRGRLQRTPAGQGLPARALP